MALLGLSKLLGKDAKQFVLLDRDTDGRAGRPVYIDVALSADFARLDDSERHLILHRLKQLRATAAGISSHSNLNDATEHKQLLGAAFVHYRVIQSTGTAAHGPGVYITKMVVANYKGHPPGLYRVRANRNGWEVQPGKCDGIHTDHAAINGGVKDLTPAAVRVLPELLSQAYSDKKWKGNLRSDGYTLFYNPPCLYDESGEWRTPDQKRFSKSFAAMQLSRALTDASRRKHETQWVIHSDGIHLLKSALEILPGVDLSNHTVLFTAPTKDVSAVLPDLNRSKMQLHDEVMRIQDADWRSKKAQMWRFWRLKRELAKIPGHQDQAHFLAAQSSKDLRSYFGYLGSAAIAGTALLSPAVPTLGSIAAATVGALAIWDKAQHLRNIAANNLDAPGLNPHLHPFDTNEQMNHRARKQSGGSLKTFADVLKMKIRR